MKFRGLISIIVAVSMLGWVSCTSKQQGTYYTMSGKVHGTYYTMIYETDSAPVTENELMEVFHRFDMSLSTFEDSSIISRINQNDETVELDSFFLKVYQRAMIVSEETNGAFDMTVAPLVNCWGFGFRKSDSVTPEMVENLMKSVGYQKIHLVDGKIVKDNPETMLDASAIAKGYSCDVVAQFLRQKGIENFMVEIGGEVVCEGINAKGKSWVIGITQPTDDNPIISPVLQARISISKGGMATSGNYRQFYVKEGRRYSHTIDPHTGYPAEHTLLSATVVAEDCMTADAFATAFMVMGLDSAMAYVSKHPELSAYFISSADGDTLRVDYSDNFKSLLLE